MLNDIRQDAMHVFLEFCKLSEASSGSLIVVGCSTSEIIGKRIGTHGSIDVGKTVLSVFMELANLHDLRLAVQCCEHLNRALVVERRVVEQFGYQPVSVIPKRHAGGALAAVAMEQFESPMVVSEVLADGGLDIGLTMIGMHLKRVAVPIRLSHNKIGEAMVVAACTRYPLIGGERAEYK